MHSTSPMMKRPTPDQRGTDFRTIDPDHIGWRSRGSTPCPAAPVLVQTPRCSCDVTREKQGSHRISLRTDPGVPSHAAFVEWMHRVEDAAAADGCVREWAAAGGATSMSRSVFRDSMRLMVFSGTPVFDPTDQASADLGTAASATCLLKLRGVWARGERWGLSWSVTQVKFEPDGGLADEEAEAERPTGCLFAPVESARA